MSHAIGPWTPDTQLIGKLGVSFFLLNKLDPHSVGHTHTFFRKLEDSVSEATCLCSLA